MFIRLLLLICCFGFIEARDEKLVAFVMNHEIQSREFNYDIFVRNLDKGKDIFFLNLYIVGHHYYLRDHIKKYYDKSDAFFANLKDCDSFLDGFIRMKDLGFVDVEESDEDYEYSLYSFKMKPLVKNKKVKLSDEDMPFIRNILSEMKVGQKKRVFVHSALLGIQKGVICDLVRITKEKIERSKVADEITDLRKLEIEKVALNEFLARLYAKYYLHFFRGLDLDKNKLIKCLEAYRSGEDKSTPWKELNHLYMEIYDRNRELKYKAAEEARQKKQSK